VSNTAEKTLALRNVISKTGALENYARAPLGADATDACLQGGLRRGTLHEVFAQASHEVAATGFAAALAFRAAVKKHVLWIRQDFSAVEFGELAATGLLELGLDPEQFLLLRVADVESVLRAASDALSCAALGAVVMEIPGEPKALDLVLSRRLTLASAQKGVTAFLLRFAAKPEASAAETRWLVRAAHSEEKENWGQPAFRADLLRNRHGSLGHWVMEWNCDDGLFREAAADSRIVVSASCNRQIATAMESATRNARRVA